MSVCLWVCLQRQGNHKTVKCFFSFPPTHFSFGWAFLAYWAGGGSRRRLMERATWTNPVWNQAARTARPARFMTLHPSFPTQRPLSGASGCIGPCPLLFVTSVYLCFLSLSCPTYTFLFLMSIYLLSFSVSLSWYPPRPSSRHPGQLFIQTGCLQLSVRSWVAVPEVGRIACGVELFPNTSFSSVRSIHDLSMTLTPQLHVFAKPPTHTAQM